MGCGGSTALAKRAEADGRHLPLDHVVAANEVGWGEVRWEAGSAGASFAPGPGKPSVVVEVLSLTADNLGKWHESASVTYRSRTAWTDKTRQSATASSTVDNMGRTLTSSTECGSLDLDKSVGVLPGTHGQRCLLCWQSVCVVGLVPCGHICICVQCGRDGLPEACPMCNTMVHDAVRYMTAEQAARKAAEEEALRREMLLRRVKAHWINKGLSICMSGWAKLVEEEARKRELCKKFMHRLVNSFTVRFPSCTSAG
jgi:hypothetical protein